VAEPSLPVPYSMVEVVFQTSLMKEAVAVQISSKGGFQIHLMTVVITQSSSKAVELQTNLKNWVRDFQKHFNSGSSQMH